MKVAKVLRKQLAEMLKEWANKNEIDYDELNFNVQFLKTNEPDVNNCSGVHVEISYSERGINEVPTTNLDSN